MFVLLCAGWERLFLQFFYFGEKPKFRTPFFLCLNSWARHHSMPVGCVDANLFGQAPSTMSCIENTVSKCRFCSIIFNIFWSWNNISGFTFLFQYEFKVIQRTLWNVFFFLLLCLVGIVVNQPFPFSLVPHICIVNLCAQWRPSMYSLCFPTVASRIQSSFYHIFHISLAGIEIAASLCNLFSPHLCDRIHWSVM